MENIKYCNDFVHKRCTRENCKFEHNPDICFHFWKFGKCKFGRTCKFKHIHHPQNSVKGSQNLRHKKNTETFIPFNKDNVDMRILFHDSAQKTKFDEDLTSKDVIIIKNLFNDYRPGEIYNSLVNEIESCGIDNEKLLMLWHGDTHFIANDKLTWKRNCPTFNMVIERAREYFRMDVQSTRFNWYKDTSQFKSYHFDAAAVKPHIAAIQNFTLAISFGATREASFERDTKDKTKISIPHHDGDCYAFCPDTNILWRHGILQEHETKQEGRISIICWSWINDIKKI